MTSLPTHPKSPPPPPPPPPGVVRGHVLLRRFGVHVSVGSVDRMRSVTWLAAGTLAIGVLYALLDKPPLALPFSLHVFVPVCPACGLTRGTIATLRGDIMLGFRYNPFAPFVPVVAGALVARTAVGLASGRWLDVRYRPTKLAWFVGLGVVGALWVYQFTRIDFLLHSRVI